MTTSVTTTTNDNAFTEMRSPSVGGGGGGTSKPNSSPSSARISSDFCFVFFFFMFSYGNISNRTQHQSGQQKNNSCDLTVIFCHKPPRICSRNSILVNGTKHHGRMGRRRSRTTYLEGSTKRSRSPNRISRLPDWNFVSSEQVLAG